MMTLRPVRDEDVFMFWRLWQNKETRRFNSDLNAVSWEQHIVWFAANLDNEHWYVGEIDGGCPIGAVRFDLHPLKDRAMVSIVVDPRRRNQGYGTVLIVLATNAYLGREPSNPVEARIHRLNTPSLKAFSKAGYRPQSEDAPWIYLVFP